MKAIGIKNILNEVRMSVASNHSRKSTNNSYKSTKLTTIQRVTPFKPESKMHFRTISNNSKADKTVSQCVKTSAVTKMGGNNQLTPTNLVKGMNDNFLFLRKENHLNTQFNIRKNKLKEITKVNKQLYGRLNTQKSFYSNSDMNKSYESTKEIRERLSQSKLSHRMNSSRSSSRKSLKTGANAKGIKKELNLEIRAKNISKINQNEVNKFRGLFIRDLNCQKEHYSQMEKDVVKFNSYRKNEYILKNKISARMSMQPVKQCNEGGMLHRVEELMNDDSKFNNQNKQRRRSLVMPNSRKLFNF